MDGFRDRFTQHLTTSEELININSQAEATETEQLAMEVHNLIESLDDKLSNITVDTQGGAGAEELAGALEEKLGQVEDKLESHIHKENVRVYRNVQAALGEELGKQVETIGEKLDQSAEHIDEVMSANNEQLVKSLSERIDILTAMMDTLNEQQKGVGATISEMAAQVNDTQVTVVKGLKSRALLVIQIVMLILLLGDLAINVLLTLGFL